jgi:predicted nucleic acid-binding protein
MTLIRDGRVRAISPALCYSEIANAYVQHVRRQLVDLDDARRSLRAAVRLPLDVRSNRSLCAAAAAVAVHTGLSAYDAHYLALAEAEDAVLVTADRRLAEGASRSVLLD